MTCDLCRAAIVERWEPGTPVPAESGAHLATCAACQRWFGAFGDGFDLAVAAGDSLAAGVLARTSVSACGRARALMAGRLEAPLGDVDSALLADHIDHCSGCAEFAVALDDIAAALPSLAALDPGPGFAERVIAVTSRRPSRPTLAERWSAVWGRLVKRPRFAWEVAYVATLCWLVFFGPSLSALEWTTATVATVAREHVPSKLDAVGRVVGQWRTTVSSELGNAGAAVEQRRGSWSESAASSLQAGVEWTRQVAAALLEGVESAIQATVAWFKDFFGALSAEPAEPPAAPARSPG